MGISKNLRFSIDFDEDDEDEDEDKEKIPNNRQSLGDSKLFEMLENG